MKRFIKEKLKNRFPDYFSALYEYREQKKYRAMPFIKLSYGFQLKGPKSMQNETFEPEETDVIINSLKNVDLFVDIGANIGYYTCIALHKGIDAIAIEPLQHNLNILYQNIKINGWDNVEIIPLALAERAGILELYGGGTGASLLNGWAGNPEIWKRFVAVSTLDIILGERFSGKRLFIKIDVEGAEYDLLQGAFSTLKMTPKPIWLLEISLTVHQPTGIHENFQKIFNLFWKNGYQAISLGKENKIVTLEDVDRWVNNRNVDFGYVSYLFSEQK